MPKVVDRPTGRLEAAHRRAPRQPFPVAQGRWPQSRSSGKGGGKGHEVFVGGLPKSADENALWSFFGQYGSVQKVQVKYDESGNPRGFCFVEFRDRDRRSPATCPLIPNERHDFDGTISCSDGV